MEGMHACTHAHLGIKLFFFWDLRGSRRESNQQLRDQKEVRRKELVPLVSLDAFLAGEDVHRTVSA